VAKSRRLATLPACYRQTPDGTQNCDEIVESLARTQTKPEIRKSSSVSARSPDLRSSLKLMPCCFGKQIVS